MKNISFLQWYYKTLKSILFFTVNFCIFPKGFREKEKSLVELGVSNIEEIKAESFSAPAQHVSEELNDRMQDLGFQIPRMEVKAKNFILDELEGREKSLDSYYGNVVLLNFWATWCGPCRQEMPALQNLHEITESTFDFRIIAVNLKENHEIVSSFVSQLSLTFPILFDNTGEIASAYGASTLPMTYLIDKDGTILSRIIGIRDWTEQGFINLFIELSIREL